jgi:hypothetical protein
MLAWEVFGGVLLLQIWQTEQEKTEEEWEDYL